MSSQHHLEEWASISVDKDTGDCSFFSGDEAQSSTTGKQSTLFSGDKSVDKDTGDCSIFSGDEAQSSTTCSSQHYFLVIDLLTRILGIVQSSQEI